MAGVYSILYLFCDKRYMSESSCDLKKRVYERIKDLKKKTKKKLLFGQIWFRN